MKSKFSRTFDFILTRAAIFAAAFVWMRYYIDDIWLTLLAAAVVTLIATVVLGLIFRRLGRGRTIKAKEYAAVRDIGNQFLLNSTAQNIEFFTSVFEKGEDCSVIPLDDCIVAKKDERTVVVYPHFSPSPVTRQTIIDFVRYAVHIEAAEIAVLCLSAEKNLEQFCQSISDVKIKIYDPVKTYALLRSYDAFPEITKRLEPPKKPGLKTLFSMALSRARTKAYLTGGLFLFAVSFFTFYQIYYLISASLLVLVGLVSFFNKRYNTGISKHMRII
jgi:hypothetical protein